jgi:hypothetical protein
LSRDRRIITRKRNKLTIVAAAGAFSVATAVSAAAAIWPSGAPAGQAGTTGTAGAAFAALRQAASPAAEHGPSPRQASLAVAHYRAGAGHQAGHPQQAAPEAAATASATPKATPRATPVPAASGSPRSIAQAMLKSFGWSSSQFSCLEPLWEHESGWSVSAGNPSTGPYGIPQAAPGSKMASAGPDWKTNASTQIKWGLGYIKGTYGSPCAAWRHEQADGWY